MSSARRADLVTTDAATIRRSAWDEVVNGELAFDFSTRRPARPCALRAERGREKVGVKEAIIRWLEEQL